MPEASKLVPLRPNWFHILLTLTDEPHHGYSIMREVEHRTDGQLKLWPATLYGTLRKLEDGDLIEPVEYEPDDGSDDERRQYYALTRFGKRVLRAEVERLEQLVRLARAKTALSK